MSPLSDRHDDRAAWNSYAPPRPALSSDRTTPSHDRDAPQEVHYFLTEPDFFPLKTFSFACNRERPLRVIRNWVVVFAVLLPVGYLKLRSVSSPGTAAVITLVTSAVTVGYIRLLQCHAGRRARLAGLTGAWHVAIGAEGIKVSRPPADAVALAWADIVKINSSDRMFEFLTAKGPGALVPRAAFLDNVRAESFLQAARAWDAKAAPTE